MQLRTIIKTRGHFPSDDAATKLIWLAPRNITADWGLQHGRRIYECHHRAPGRLFAAQRGRRSPDRRPFQSTRHRPD